MHEYLRLNETADARREGGRVRLSGRRRQYHLALLLASAALPSGAFAQARQSDSTAVPEIADGEIVVTATRAAETLNKVPISMAALGSKQLDDRGIKNVEDIVKTVPGVSVTRVAGAGTNIAIRGISSQSGASTTGIYINDTPIQSRAIGQSFSFATAYPVIFDLERVEVLRGPQGTLFGAGSEGGTVRFITPRPNLDRLSVYARGELATTDRGAASYEAGAAVGAPIIEGKIGLRASAFFRRDGGIVDRIDPITGQTLDKDIDSTESTALRGAMTFAPSEILEITPSILYQKIDIKNRSGYDPFYSDRSSGRFNTSERIASPTKDRVTLPSLDIKLNAGPVDIYSNTSYLDRKSDLAHNLGRFVASLFGTVSPQLLAGQLRNYSNLTFDTNSQKAFSQEVRLQSADNDSPLRWVVGAFYQKSKQRSIEVIPDTLANIDLLTTTLTGLDSQALLGPLVRADLGSGLTDYSYINDVRGIDKQLAGFIDVTYKITDRLSVNGGVRIARTKFTFTSSGDGPFNGGFASSTGRQKESPVTPKFNISYQADPDNLFYATASKGYRVGGANASLPGYCLSELGPLGYASVPDSYNSDSVWSYEIGSKNAFFDRRLRTSASIYQINWSNIQQTVNITCGGFVDNLGKARSRGFDLSVEAKITDDLDIAVSAGYTNAKFTETLLTGGSAVVRKGDPINISPWLVSVTANQRIELAGRDLAFRVDYQYQAAVRRGPEFNPLTSQFNPRAYQRQAQHNLNLRVGTQFYGLELALFGRNVLNSHVTAFSLTENRANNLFDDFQAVRPRTVGIQATYRM